MPAARAHINITPLIDVMLVLLIICMLMPHTHHTLAAHVPAPPAEAPDRTPPTPLVVEVGSGLALNGKTVEGMDELRQQLEIALAVRADRTVFVRSSGNPTYGRVVEAMDTARAAGAERLGLLTNGNQPPSSQSTRNP
jgi:biopolymer transport protein TolR